MLNIQQINYLINNYGPTSENFSRRIYTFKLFYGKYLNDNKIPIVIFLELSKAFDTLDQYILLYKMLK